MPKLGFNGKLMVRCTPEQTATLKQNLERHGQQPAEVGRQLVAAACRYLEAGGRLSFPLRVIGDADLLYELANPSTPLAAETDIKANDTAAVKAALAPTQSLPNLKAPAPKPQLQRPRGSHPIERPKRGK